MGVVKGQGHTIGPVSYQLTSFLFHINQTNNSGDRAILKFDLETSKVKVMSEVKGQCHILYPVSNQYTSFSFHINRTNHSWDMAKIVFDLEKTHPNFLKKISFAKITVLNRISPQSNQIITMTRATKLPRFVVIRWVILTSSCRQENFCEWMPQPWPWFKVMERSSSTFPQTHIFFVPYIKGLAQMVLTWEGKVFAAADADEVDAADTKWKHKVTPDRGDLIISYIHWITFISMG